MNIEKTAYVFMFIPSNAEKNRNTKTAEKSAVLGHYAASSVNFLHTFRENLFVPSFCILDPYRWDLEVVPLRR